MSNIVINGTTYNGIESITVKDTAGSDVKYTKGDRPSGTIEITENGVHDVTNYESANVNVQIGLIDVDTLPTENVEDDKVYRAIKSFGMYYVFLEEAKTLNDFFSFVGININVEEIIVNSIDEVTNPKQITDTNMYIYTDASTYTGYMFGDIEGTGEVTRFSLVDFLNMAGFLGMTFTNKGKVDSTSQMTEAGGVYYLADIRKETTIGVPNSENNKDVYEYNGTEWVQPNPLTKDKIVGLWVNESGDYYYEFKNDNTLVEKDNNGTTIGMTKTYSIQDGKVLVLDIDGNTFEYEYVVTDGIPKLNGLTRVTEIQVSGGTDRLQWKCDNVKSLAYEFNGYTGTDLSILEGLDTSQVTNMGYIFYKTRIKKLPMLDMSSVTNMTYFASLNISLTTVPQYNTSNVVNMSNAFADCSILTTIPLLDTSSVTDMSSVFKNCYQFNELPLLDTSSVTNMSSAFMGTRLTTIPLLDTSSVTNMYAIFQNSQITTIPQLNMSKVTSLYNAFASCYNLTILPELDTSSVTNMSSTFTYCSNLKEILGLNLISVTNLSSAFTGCAKLETLILKNIKANLSIGLSSQFGHLLTNASLLNTAQELWDNTGNALGGTRKLTMATPSKTAIQSIYVKLVDVTDEMIANDEYITNKKPCVECASTDEGAMTLEEYIISKNWVIG